MVNVDGGSAFIRHRRRPYTRIQHCEGKKRTVPLTSTPYLSAIPTKVSPGLIQYSEFLVVGGIFRSDNPPGEGSLEDWTSVSSLG